MARKASTPEITPMPEINVGEARKEMADLSSSELADEFAMDSYDVLRQVGQIQGLEFTRRVVDVATAQIFDNIKKGKKYAGLPYKDEQGNTRHVGDLEQFCRVFLGKSYNRCLELAQNLHLLGPELYEQAEHIGFRARDYQALKALPPEDQEIVKQAIESDSKDTVIELLQDMAVKHKAEKEALTKKLEDTQHDYDALSKVEADTSKKLREAKLELERTQLRTAPWSEKVAPFQIEIAKRQAVIDESLGRHLQAVEALDAWWLAELSALPDYDPEAPAEMPLEVRTVLVELHDAINRGAHLIAAARNELHNRFGVELQHALQHQLQLDSELA
jgi:hypothetical protein